MNPRPDYFQWAVVFDKNPGLLLGTKTTTASLCALISLQNPLSADSFSKYETKVIPNKVCIIRLHTIKYCIKLCKV